MLFQLIQQKIQNNFNHFQGLKFTHISHISTKPKIMYISTSLSNDDMIT